MAARANHFFLSAGTSKVTMAYADLATKKTMARLSASLNESASDASHMKQSSFARKQLERMGWKEGTGLGKKRDGMVTHIRTKKREESVGLGGEKKIVEEQSNMWWSDSVGNTLARLQQAKKRKSMSSDNGSDDDDSKAKKKAKKSKKSKSKSDKKEKKRSKKKKSNESDISEVKTYTDQELFVATGGARFGMRAQRRAEGKWARTESGSKLWEEEEEARKKIEWNGLGNAKLLLESAACAKGGKSESDSGDNDSSASGSARDEPVIIEEISHTKTSTKEKKAKASKKRKDVTDDDGDAKASEKKRRKKEKKKAKRAKAS